MDLDPVVATSWLTRAATDAATLSATYRDVYDKVTDYVTLDAVHAGLRPANTPGARDATYAALEAPWP